MIEYVFKKPYTCDMGTIEEGSTIREVRQTIYFNGGMVLPAYAKLLREIINDKEICEEYIVKKKIIENKV